MAITETDIVEFQLPVKDDPLSGRGYTVDNRSKIHIFFKWAEFVWKVWNGS